MLVDVKLVQIVDGVNVIDNQIVIEREGKRYLLVLDKNYIEFDKMIKK